MQVQNYWRRAGARYGAVGRLVIVTVAAAVLVAAAALPFVGIAGVAARDASQTFNELDVGSLGQAPARSALYDATGHVITYFYPNNIYRVPVSYNQIAPVMRDAIVAIEDYSFYKQGALDPRGTLRALLSNSSGGQLQGASTLAQQYVKNVRVLQARTAAEATAAAYPSFQRKIQQLRIASTVEHEMTQNQLLAAYLNVAYFSNHAYGIEVAAQRYFSKPASALTLPEAAMLAGMVQSPTLYDPFSNPANAKDRRNEVLNRMWELRYITKAQDLAAQRSGLGLHPSTTPLNTGCTGPQAARAAFFCDYVQHVLEKNYPLIWNQINTTGGLAIHTTMNLRDQLAADAAVKYVEPGYNYSVNPGHNADTEVLVQPGTGAVRAIAVNRKFGPGGEDIDYAVNSDYGGGAGVQTGSSSKIFTLITALKAGYPFGHTIKVKSPAVVSPFTNCHGDPVINTTPLSNAEGPSKGTEVWQMNQATVDSINMYFVNLEQQVGLCNVVKTAVDMGMTRADGRSLLKPDPTLGRINGISADNVTSFTLGAVYVSPMNMALAYASVAARGWYCSPQVLTSISVMSTGQQLPVQPAECHRDMSRGVADAANYILQGVLTVPGATAAGRNGGIRNHVAGKTGTANGGFYAAFAGYSPTLAGYVSVFNPTNPTGLGAMIGTNSCYRDLTGESCPGQMFGDNAPAATWQYTFQRAALGPDIPFVYPPSSFFSNGNGLGAPKTIGGHHKHGGGGGNGGPPGPPTTLPPPTGGPSPNPSPTPTP